MSDELQRQININLHLRRQLERARREVMLYAAQVCEDHDVGFYGKAGWVLVPLGQGEKFRHAGAAYAKKLREIAGE